MNRTFICAALLGAAATPALADLSDGKVRIGVLNDQSGVYADTTGRTAYHAALVAVEEFGGTVLGQQIEVVTADHQNKPDVAANIARQWYDIEQVDAVFDVPNSAAALAVQGLARDKQRINVISGGGTTELTGAQCSPYGFHWSYDTRALAVGTGGALVKEGGDSWYFLTSDYAFGHSLEENATGFITENGGEVLGASRHPLGNTDYSSFLLQAQSTGARVIGLASAGMDTQTAIKQAAEFGIPQSGITLAGLLFTLPEVHGLGLESAQGLVLTESYYWNRDDRSRELGQKVFEKAGTYPNMMQAGVYSAVLHYLKAVEAAGTDDADAVAAKMRELPVEDLFTSNGRVAANGRMFSDLYLMRVKKPGESDIPWDYYDVVATVPADVAYLDPKLSGCPLVE